MTEETIVLIPHFWLLRVVVLFANAVLTLHKYFKFEKSLRIGIAWALK